MIHFAFFTAYCLPHLGVDIELVRWALHLPPQVDLHSLLQSRKHVCAGSTRDRDRWQGFSNGWSIIWRYLKPIAQEMWLHALRIPNINQASLRSPSWIFPYKPTVQPLLFISLLIRCLGNPKTGLVRPLGVAPTSSLEQHPDLLALNRLISATWPTWWCTPRTPNAGRACPRFTFREFPVYLFAPNWVSCSLPA